MDVQKNTPSRPNNYLVVLVPRTHPGHVPLSQRFFPFIDTGHGPDPDLRTQALDFAHTVHGQVAVARTWPGCKFAVVGEEPEQQRAGVCVNA